MVNDGSHPTPIVAAFVTPHGFGHAARCCAVLEALARRRPNLEVELLTTVPRWFFEDSLSVPFRYHEVECDVGLVQRDALTADPVATADRLEELVPFDDDLVGDVVDTLVDRDCRLVVCDIAPLGLLAGRKAGLPAVLVENFTWDWIYRAYVEREPRMRQFAAAMEEMFDLADRRIQARPICRRLLTARAVAPIARRVRRERTAVRDDLGLGVDDRAVLVSMGGIRWDFGGLDQLDVPSGTVLVVPGGAESERRIAGAVLLPFRSRFYHPDLVEAADAVVAKLGYSTVAEACGSGRALGYLRRPGFPESPVLEEFVRAELAAVAIEEEELRSGRWIERLDALLALESSRPTTTDGADEAATAIDELLATELP